MDFVKNAYKDTSTQTFCLKEEKLDIINKKWVRTAKVNVYKEVLIEEKKIIIPIRHEYLVIKKRNLQCSNLENNKMEPEVIRLHLREEQVSFTKKLVELQNVCIRKEKIKDVKHIEETLKKEKIKIKVAGLVKVLNRN